MCGVLQDEREHIGQLGSVSSDAEVTCDRQSGWKMWPQKSTATTGVASASKPKGEEGPVPQCITVLHMLQRRVLELLGGMRCEGLGRPPDGVLPRDGPAEYSNGLLLLLPELVGDERSQ